MTSNGALISMNIYSMNIFYGPHLCEYIFYSLNIQGNLWRNAYVQPSQHQRGLPKCRSDKVRITRKEILCVAIRRLMLGCRIFLPSIHLQKRFEKISFKSEQFKMSTYFKFSPLTEKEDCITRRFSALKREMSTQKVTPAHHTILFSFTLFDYFTYYWGEFSTKLQNQITHRNMRKF